MGRVCFLSYIPYGNTCVQSDCSRLLVCACVHVFTPGAALRFSRYVLHITRPMGVEQFRADGRTDRQT